MNHATTAGRIAAALAAAAILAACNGGHNSGSSPPPAQTVGAATSFTLFTQDIFASPANSTPATLNGVNINFDADNNPMAFAALLM